MEDQRVLPDTTARVASHTAAAVNERIRRQTEASVAFFASHPQEIDHRLRELDAEWDIERALEANAASLAFGGTLLGALIDRRWLLVPAVVTAFLLQHALQGWCPPVPLLRRLGVRTASEIDAERYALKALRGDFRHVSVTGNARRRARAVLHAVRQ